MTSIGKIGLVARRDFIAAVATKGFIFGLLIMPAMFALIAVMAPRIMNGRSPQVRGDVAVIDPTGRVAGELREALAPAAIARRSAEDTRQATDALPAQAKAASDAAIQQALGQVPELRLLDRGAGATVDQEKGWLLAGTEGERHLAMIAVKTDAVEKQAGKSGFGSYELYVSPGLDQATESIVHESMRQAIVNARLQATSLDRAAVEATMRVDRPASVIVSDRGEQQSQRGFTSALPFILGILMFMGIMFGGQGLMTSTVEEKSSRVVEVLLASVSPVELMAGKLIAQLGIGLMIIAMYVGLGFLALFQFAMFGLVNPVLILYLLVFFVISYLVYGALMMAIGAAVNQMQEAQSLMGPVMMLLVLPYVLTSMVGRAPNSTMSVVLSFVPPVNTFIMLARLASDTPPPMWQVGLTVLIGCAAACAAVWFAAKVFRIGLLMHGKPPNFMTLLKWARAA